MVMPVIHDDCSWAHRSEIKMQYKLKTLVRSLTRDT